MLQILSASLVIMLASLGGVISVWYRAGRFIERHLAYLVSLSAGVFLVVTWELAEEVIGHSGWGTGIFWIVAGVFLVSLIFKSLPAFHHHHDDHEETEAHSQLDARRILVGDAVHNIGDGLLIATAFATSLFLGVITTISIFVHELVQEVSEFFVLRQAGFSLKKALITNFAVSGTILIGALGGTFFLKSFESLEAPLLGLAAGSFLVVVAFDLIPHSVRHSKNRTHYASHIGWFLVGVILMLAVNSFLGH